MLTSVLVVTKNHEWLALACVALYLVGSCGASLRAPWPCGELMTVATESAADRTSDVLSGGAAGVEPDVGNVRLSDAAKDAFIEKCNAYLTKLIQMSDGSTCLVHSGAVPASCKILRDMSKIFLRSWAQAREHELHRDAGVLGAEAPEVVAPNAAPGSSNDSYPKAASDPGGRPGSSNAPPPGAHPGTDRCFLCGQEQPAEGGGRYTPTGSWLCEYPNCIVPEREVRIGHLTSSL